MSVLNHLKVKGFKSLQHVECTFGQLNVIVGAPGSGKSNLFQLFDLFARIGQQGLEGFSRQVLFSELFYLGIQDELIELRLELRKNRYAADLVFHPPNVLFFKRESVGFIDDSGLYHELAVERNHKESMLSAQSDSAISPYILRAFASMKPYICSTDGKAPARQLSEIADHMVLRHDGSNLASMLLGIKARNRQVYQQIVSLVRAIFPTFDDFDLQNRGLYGSQTALFWREVGVEMTFTPQALPSNVVQMAFMAVLVLQPQAPLIILLEEPERGLHPYAQVLLSALLKQAAEQSQVFLTTQSSTLLTYLAPDEIYVLSKPAQATQISLVERETLAGWLEAYDLGQLWEKNCFGGRVYAL